MRFRPASDVDPDYSKIAGCEFKNIRAAAQRSGHCSVRMRIRPQSALEHAVPLTIVRYRVNILFASLLGVSRPNPSRRIVANVARQLKAERIRRGVSMTKLAGESGLSQQMISYVERGMRSPTLDTLLRIAAVLDIDLSAVIKAAAKRSSRK